MSLKSICFSVWLPSPSPSTAAPASISSPYSFPLRNPNHSVSNSGSSRPHLLHFSNKLDSASLSEDDDDYDSDSEAEKSEVDIDVDIELEIEKTGANCRRIRSEIGIEAPLATVWNLLTDYERLADFIPGLAVCQLLQKSENYARLFQIGEQDLAFGLKFNAKGVVDCFENPLESIANDLGGLTLKRDIEFDMVEGDFEIFRGKWSLQQLNTSGEMACDPLIDQKMQTTTTLSYLVDVKPKMLLPVQLVEGRLCKEIKINLACIREEAMKMTRETLLTR
ncbi:putative START-like domain-containing protein [Rosa chinensis]|uniref:Putative START-like domain-containing protein n=1 Tax=Rosa chinensis TaxID=74649 RepID=A0A2P6RF28_ROSCH|nr:uncharacterized protein LOC112193100 [Rosa chinensis]PRQ45015.1 putative START-like domain-containing protein [Rosa chinensis]